MNTNVAMIASRLRGQEVGWLKANQKTCDRSDTITLTEQAVNRAELLWGVNKTYAHVP